MIIPTPNLKAWSVQQAYRERPGGTDHSEFRKYSLSPCQVNPIEYCRRDKRGLDCQRPIDFEEVALPTRSCAENMVASRMGGGWPDWVNVVHFSPSMTEHVEVDVQNGVDERLRVCR